MGLAQGPLSLVSIIEKLLEWKSSSPGSRNPRLTAVGICCADHVQNLVLTSSTSGGRLVGIVFLLTKATEFSFSGLLTLPHIKMNANGIEINYAALG
jgi:hypothetical protein